VLPVEPSLPLVPLSLISLGCDSGGHGALTSAVCTATGPVGLLVIWVYSFLIAFVLPLPSEVVLPPAEALSLGLPVWLNYVVVIVVSGFGKAAGSVFAFHIGQEAKESGPILRLLRRSRFDVLEWSENKVVQLSKRFGYIGLAIALSVPGFPDTLSIYAFSVLEEDYLKFAAATFAGSAGRLIITIAVVWGGLTLL
jgi:membrane protein YqaA with SNARE-associated domain